MSGLDLRPNVYNVGDLARVSATYYDNTQSPAALFDPSSVTVKVLAPDNSVSTLSVVHDGTGLYHADVNVQLAGDYVVLFESTGTGQAAKERRIRVAVPAMPR